MLQKGPSIRVWQTVKSQRRKACGELVSEPRPKTQTTRGDGVTALPFFPEANDSLKDYSLTSLVPLNCFLRI